MYTVIPFILSSKKQLHYPEHLYMKTSTLNCNNISPEVADLITRLIALIPWPVRRQAMGDVVLTILNGKPRVAEDAFGWNRSAVAPFEK